MALLSDDDCKLIERAIADVEKRSATELVVAVIPKSASYVLGRALVALAWSLGVALALLRWAPELDATLVVLLELPAAALAFALFSLPPLQRLLIAPAQAARAVEQRAFALFSERGLHRTQQRSGMLILVSELEHRVVILGDSAIHEKVGASGWQEHVAHIIKSIKAGQAARGLVEVIERLGQLHGELLPVLEGDTNELPDQVVRD